MTTHPPPVSKHSEFLACRDYILRAFNKQAKKRDRHPHSWVLLERHAVVNAANEWAMSHGLPAVSIGAVERVESSAVGHVDYASKWALYVAELMYYAEEGPEP